MYAVSDPSPLVRLAIIGQLKLVRDQAGEAGVLSVVRKELLTDEERPGRERLKAASQSSGFRAASKIASSFVIFAPVWMQGRPGRWLHW